MDKAILYRIVDAMCSLALKGEDPELVMDFGNDLAFFVRKHSADPVYTDGCGGNAEAVESAKRRAGMV